MLTQSRVELDKVQATHDAIKSIRAAIELAPDAAHVSLELFIRFVEKTWLDKPVRADQN